MSIELTTLSFKVDTKELETAITKVGELGEAVSKVNTPLSNVAKNSKSVAKGVDEFSEAASKASRGTGKLADSSDAVNLRLQKLKDQLGFLRNDLDLSETGLTKMQAGLLSNMKAIGATDTQLKEFAQTFDKFNRLIGEQAFDKSVAGLNMLNRQMREFDIVNELAAKGANLTATQVKQLTRDIESLTQQNIEFGRSSSSGVEELKTKYINAANAVNQLVASSKAAEAAAKKEAESVVSAAKATAYLESETSKLLFTNQQIERGLSSASANALYKYKQNLEATGASAMEVKQKLYLLEQELRKKQGTSVISEMRNDIKKLGQDVDHLGRGIGVQFTDIWVSLANGQGVFQVMSQQLPQIADMFALARVEGGSMADVLVSGARSLYVSYKSVATGFVELFGRGIKGAGNAVVGFGSQILGLNLIMDSMKRTIASTGESGFRFIGMLNKIGAVAAIAAGAVVALAGVFTVTLLAAFIQADKQINQLSKSLILNGASLGQTADSAILLAQGMSGIGISTSAALDVMQEMAKVGGFTAEQITIVTESAVLMNKNLGVSVEETVKKYSELGKKPTEELLKLAVATGRVSPELVKMIYELEKSGDKAKAVAEAFKIMSSVNKEQVEEIKRELTAFGKFLFEFKDMFVNMWQGVKNLVYQGTEVEKVSKKIKELESNLVSLYDQDGAEARSINKQLAEQVAIRDKLLGKQKTEAQQRADASKAASDLTKALEVEEEIKKRISSVMDKDTLKTLSRTQYVNKEIDEYKKKVGEANVNQQTLVKLTQALGVEWDNANKKTGQTTDKLSKDYSKILESFTKITAGSEDYNNSLSESQKKLNEILRGDTWNKLNDSQKTSIILEYERANAAEFVKKQVQEELKLREKLQQENFKYLNDLEDTYEKINKEFTDQDKVLENNSKNLEFQFSLIGKTAKEQEQLTQEYEKQLKIKDAELKLEEQLAVVRKLESSGLYLDAAELKLKAEKQYAEKVRQINSETALKAAQDYQKEFEAVQATITDIIATALFEGGKAGQKKLKDVLKNSFRNFVIDVFINPITKDLAGLFSSGSSAGSAASGAGGISSGVSMLGNLSNITNFLNGTTMINSVTTTIGKIGTTMMQSSVKSVADAGATLVENANQFGKVLGSVGNAFAAYNISKMISGGYKTNALVDIATTIGGYFFGPIAGVVGGLVNRAFGRKAPVTVAQGLTGSFSTSGADVQQYQQTFAKGGWFRSDKWSTNYSAVDSGFDQFLDQSLVGITTATKIYASILGQNAEAINGISQSINISLMNLSAEQQQEAISNALSAFGDLLASKYVSGFVRDGEKAGAALSRLATSFIAVNNALDTLNITLLEASLLSGDAASKLIDLFEGTDKFSASISSYYSNFYSEQEQLANVLEQLQGSFDMMGLTLPTTRDQYKELVAAQDLMTESGRATFKALIDLSPAFAEMTSAIEELSSSVQDEVKRLRGLLTTESPVAQAGLEAQFATLTAQARAGDANALERLPEISQAIEQAAMLTAVTAADVARVRGWLAGSLSDTLGVLGMQVPQFAVGTNYVPQDTLAVVHKGEAIVPRAYNPAAGGVSSDSEMIAELRSLREEVVMLRAETRATAINTNKSTKILERVTQDGESLMVTPTV